jgi:serine/threonine-protein kinase
MVPRDETEATVVEGKGAPRARHPSEAPPSDPHGTAAMLDEVRRPPAERLDLQASIAQGGMGRIDVAFDRALGRQVAKKTIHPELFRRSKTLRLFLREARIQGQLDHPNIVPVYDIEEREDELFFTMKLVRGKTLRAMIRALPEGPVDHAVLLNLVDIVARVCDALAFAHSRGIIHCDVKPDNVMVGDFGQVYLMDWGIARFVGERDEDAESDAPSEDGDGPTSTTDHAIIGTASYMSPEQARGERSRLDARSDVFLTGGLLYEILVRRPPYKTDSMEKTLELAAEGRFTRPSEIAEIAPVHPELERILLKAMAPDPAHRYPDTDALKEDLVRFSRGGAEFPQTTFPRGAYIVREGEQGNTAYIIVSGRCQVLKAIDNTMTVLQTLGPGDVFGEMAVLNEGPRSATVMATEETTVLVVSGEVLRQELRGMKPWMASLLQRLAGRLQDMYATRRAQTFMSGPPVPKLANQLFMHLSAWGERTKDGGLVGKWSEVASALEAQLGAPPISIGMVVAKYPQAIAIDFDADLIEVRRPDLLADQLRADLSKKG